jgi:hypothetical protein
VTCEIARAAGACCRRPTEASRGCPRGRRGCLCLVVKQIGYFGILWRRQLADGSIPAMTQVFGRARRRPCPFSVAVGDEDAPAPRSGGIEARTPIIPYGGFSGVRAGRLAFQPVPSQSVAQLKPDPGIRGPSAPLRPTFGHRAAHTDPLCVGSGAPPSPPWRLGILHPRGLARG